MNCSQNANQNHKEVCSLDNNLEVKKERRPRCRDRRVIEKDSLYEDSNLFNVEETEVEVKQSEPSFWSKQGWLHAGEAKYEPEPRQRNNKNALKNKFQKKLTNALAQPVQVSKAQSMMEKMGWTGGALGKSGHGILEPIAPDATYASTTHGLGLLTLQPPKQQQQPKKKKGQTTPKTYKPKKCKQFFRTRVLHNILEFVKNDREIEVLFDTNLQNYERKLIHSLVNEVINGDSLVNYDSTEQIALIQQIQKHNTYELCTQSEGERPNRALCLYKDAPAHIYLVTPDDLNDEDCDDDDNEKTENETCEEFGRMEVCDDKNMETNVNENGLLNESSNSILEYEELAAFEDESDTTKENVDANVTAKLIEYFIEFSEQDDYTEFRFLGPFSYEEVFKINDFINNLHYCMNYYEVSDENYEDLLSVIRRGGFQFQIKEDCNQSIVIYKEK